MGRKQSEESWRGARGWYLVSWSHELGPAAVRPLRYFGREYVLYRGEDGVPVLLDAFCPHLGAHLGHGGTVRGNSIVCPFHAWNFGSDGLCNRIPYGEMIPEAARVQSYALREHSGMILAWFSSDQHIADYEVPEIGELSDPAWTTMAFAEIEIATEAREVIENIADFAHFRVVHNMVIDEFKVSFDGPRATQWTLGRGRNLKNEPIPVESTATYHGPAVQFTRLAWAFPMVLINAHIPIEEERLLLRFGVSLRAGEGVTLPTEVIDAHVASARDGYFEDVAIWENKLWRDKPLLIREDGPIWKVRKWYSNFLESSPS